jgi:DNA polymerase-1
LIVTRSTFPDFFRVLVDTRSLALDTETTGLRPYHGDELFSIIMHDGSQAYYLNFNDYPDLDDDFKLRDDVELVELRRALIEPRFYFLHNAKFDMAMLARHGIRLAGTIHDTMVTARVLDSTLWVGDFSLDACAKRLGHEKLDTVKTYLLANGLYDEERVEGKKTKTKKLHFSLAPWDLIVPYGERDAEITYELGARQRQDLQELEDATSRALPSIRQVYENECRLVQTVFRMEERVVLIDRDFCRRAITKCQDTLQSSEAAFAKLTGETFKDSNLTFQKAFVTDEPRWVYGAPSPVKGKRTPSFDSDVLETFENPAAKLVLAWRKAKSDVNYYLGFLHAADKDGVIHANFNQHVAATGRFSSSEPNLQNLTKTEDDDPSEFLVRRAIVPRPGMVFHMLDYDQVEYRLMLDYAAKFAVDKEGVLELIRKVLGGLDVHQATADVAGVTRRDAKTTNFATLYGSGVANLSGRLGVSESRAREIRDSIFRAAPEIRTFIRRVTDAAEKRGYVVNWFGRRCAFPDANFAYRAPNYIIQGGCADVVKLAMNRIDDYLAKFQTKLVLMIHDELVFEGPPEEAATVIPAVKKIMETCYPAKLIPLTCGVDHSFKSLADKIEGVAPCLTPELVSTKSCS